MVKVQPTVIIWTNFVDPELNAIYQDSAQKLSWFWRRRVLSVLPYMGMAAILINGQ